MKQMPLMLSMLLLSVASCNEKEQPVSEEQTTNTKEVTKEAIVGSYVVSKVEQRSNGQRSDITSTWFSSYAGDCAKDDVTTFKSDDSFMVLDGTIPCEESTDDTGTWKLLDKTRLKIDTDTAIVEALTPTTLRIINPVYSFGQAQLIFTYTRK